MDEGRISFGPAVELSYLIKTEQKTLLDVMGEELCTPSLSQAQQLKKMSNEKQLQIDKIGELMRKPKPNQVLTIKIPEDSIRKYVKSNATKQEKEDFLVKAVEYYGKHLLKQKDRGDR